MKTEAEQKVQREKQTKKKSEQENKQKQQITKYSEENKGTKGGNHQR